MTGFTTYLNLRAMPDPGEWALISPLRYTMRMGYEIVVPAGFITDLASIPRAFRGVFSVNGRSRMAAVLHDWLYCSQSSGARPRFSRAECDAIFYEALAACDVGLIERNAMWLGVRAGGWLYWGRRVRCGLSLDDFCGLEEK